MTPHATKSNEQFSGHPEVASPIVLKLASVTPQKCQGEVVRAKGRGGLRALLCGFDYVIPSACMWEDFLGKGLSSEHDVGQILGSVDSKPSSTEEQRIIKMNSEESF